MTTSLSRRLRNRAGILRRARATTTSKSRARTLRDDLRRPSLGLAPQPHEQRRLLTRARPTHHDAQALFGPLASQRTWQLRHVHSGLGIPARFFDGFEIEASDRTGVSVT